MNVTVASGSTYMYQVFAQAYVYATTNYTNSATPAGPVTITDAVPLAPSNVGASAGTVAGTINVTWTDNSNNESGFTVQRSLLSTGAIPTWGAWGAAGTVGVNVTTFQDTGRITGRSYRYQVRANSVVGNSLFVGPTNTVVAP